MTNTPDRSEVIADDGLRARDNGEWAEQKLDFISTFGPPALAATSGKRSRWYVDLFAGPGINVLRGTNREIEGSPLRAIELSASTSAVASFTDTVFVNRDRRDHAALGERLRRRVAEERCRVSPERLLTIRGDANALIGGIMSQIHPRAYAFVFADMEAPRQFPWSSVEALRAQGHESVDLYMLFPLDMALKRLLSSKPKTVEQSAATLTAFYGNDEWRALLRHREGSSHELGRAAQSLYESQLRAIWPYVGEVCDIRRGQNHRLYKMLYASKDPAGKRIADWASKRNAHPSLFD